MPKQALAQLVDSQSLAEDTGRLGCIALEVPPAWIREGASLELTVGKRVACARCDGGGCDSCARSGAHRIASSSRQLTVHLPASEATALRVRLVQPFACQSLSQLWVDVRSGENASRNVRRLVRSVAKAEMAHGASWLPWAVLVLLLGLLAVWASL